jgi:putative DNA primase/helicase
MDKKRAPAPATTEGEREQRICAFQAIGMIPAEGIDVNGIPQGFRERHQWVCWRYETGATGKPSKVPVNARSGTNASVTDPATWSSFEEAIAASHRYDGIGLVLTEEDPYVGVDLDGCIDSNGTLAPWAERIVRLLNSYTEVTPSRRGLRILVRGALPPGGRRTSIRTGEEDQHG